MDLAFIRFGLLFDGIKIGKFNVIAKIIPSTCICLDVLTGSYVALPNKQYTKADLALQMRIKLHPGDTYAQKALNNINTVTQSSK
jgi:hypothetical protein